MGSHQHTSTFHRAESAGHTQEQSEFSPPSNERQPVILLVEDDVDVLRLTRAFLEATGYAVLSCSSGPVAAQVFRKAPGIDLLLTDLQMPGQSGMELATELTALQPSLPVLVVSGAIRTEALDHEMQAHNWRFVAKPWVLTDLLAEVHAILNRNASGPWANQAFDHEAVA